MTGSFHAGAGRAVITPPLGIPLGGNARLNNYASGVFSELYARALWLDSGPDAVCLVSLDLLAMWASDAWPLRQAVAAQVGIQPESVLVACTHTHSGPDMLSTLCWHEEKLRRDEALLKPYRDILMKGVLEAATQARRSAVLAEAFWGKAQDRDIGHNRRLRRRDGSTCMNWELPPTDDVDAELGPIDPQVSVLCLRRADGSLIAAVSHYACHAAILAGLNTEISGDYCGLAMVQLEQENAAIHASGRPVFLFFQGAAGNVNHIDYRFPERGRDRSEVQRCARLLVQSVKTAMERSGRFDPLPLRSSARELLLPLRAADPPVLQQARTVLDNYDGHDISLADGIPPELHARRILKLDEARKNGKYDGPFAEMRDGQVVLPLQIIQVGNVTLATVPGEVFVEFGLRLKARAGTDRCLLVTLANGHTGYIPTEESFPQGGYEPGLGPSCLVEDAGDRIVEALLEMRSK